MMMNGLMASDAHRVVASVRRGASGPRGPQKLVADGEPGVFILPGTEWCDLYEEITGAGASTLSSVDGVVGTIHDKVTNSYWTVEANDDRLTLREDGGGRWYLEIPDGKSPMQVSKPALPSNTTGLIAVAEMQNTSAAQNWINIKQDSIDDPPPNDDAVHIGWCSGGQQGFGVRDDTGWNDDYVVDGLGQWDDSSAKFVLEGWWEGAGTKNKARIDGGATQESPGAVTGCAFDFTVPVSLGGTHDRHQTKKFRLWGLIIVRKYTADRLALAHGFVTGT